MGGRSDLPHSQDTNSNTQGGGRLQLHPPPPPPLPFPELEVALFLNSQVSYSIGGGDTFRLLSNQNIPLDSTEYACPSECSLN